ncbi:MAG: translation initiation factor IF-2 [Methanosarcinales archaeon]
MKKQKNQKNLRTPIVCVVGHVDHGKTTLLDKIRGTTIADKEAGAITQHIGATEVPLNVIKKVCGALFKGNFLVPGLLFIDTPGHHAFTTLRSRGGALADLAIVIVDIKEGFKPQTYESINLLKRFKTPFVVATNKVDRIPGWNPHPREPFLLTYKKQGKHVQQLLDEKIYNLIELLYDEGFSSDRYDRIRDFQRNIGVIPISAKTGEGIPDILMVLVGLAQKFLEKDLHYRAKGAGVGTVLEIKEEKGLGTTLDVILYDGELKVRDTIVVGGSEKPIITKVRALLKPRPLHEIRSEEKFKSIKHVTAASGIKVAAPNLEGALAGAPLRVADKDINKTIKEVQFELEKVKIETSEKGIFVKADAIGSLEAIANELKNAQIKIWRAEVGDLSKRDIIEVETLKDPLLRVLLGFNVKILPDAEEYLNKSEVKVFTNNVIYKLIEDYQNWIDEQKAIFEKKIASAIIRPGRFRILPDYIFRQSKPAVVGVEVLGGMIKPNVFLMKEDGSRIGIIKGIQEHNKNISEAKVGKEVAVSIDGPIVGRHIHEGETLYVDIPEKHAKALEQELYDTMTADEIETFELFLDIKRKHDIFWAK